MTHLAYLFAGLALAWGVVFVYLWSLARRGAALQRRIEALEAELGDRDQG